MNSEGELPLDVATEDAMERLLKAEIKKQGERALSYSTWRKVPTGPLAPFSPGISLRPEKPAPEWTASSADVSALELRVGPSHSHSKAV